ncbi:SusC/RagA family TonB-linked outer membrane protein [Pedobacter hartonius]|uniref:TonB-linked outer membrane protein, SusC/RagA family n=1 Tax=Pedobacter hartonius TaxID=425514 RepID=A0A1H4F685_9SPHI|nr:SusC/RagA family TonB-linked outer membrane protein [Pedobacter hartonius]SEA92779.1 TonB-linked outer membrane protein, SusC/RagA family [Pedobacter hartonius]
MNKLILSMFVFLFLAGNAIAQNRTVTGTITSQEDKLPIPGVSVKLIGAPGGTVSGSDGTFSISVPSSVKTIQLSFLGYVSQTVNVPVSGRLNVALASDSKGLNEVVVTALGLNRQSKTLGYSSTQVSSEEINRAAPTNLVSGLQGKVAGVDISNTSGSPGGSSKVILRGFTSISGNNQPLYVVDGVPVNNSRPGGTAPANSIGDLSENYDFGNAANDINPNDIESISILKGAAASSLYGSRASNGVILITTKKGKEGKLKINFSSAASFTQVSIVPDLQEKFGQGWGYQNYLAENGSWGPRLDGQIRPWGSVVDGVQQEKPFTAVKNNFRDAFDTGAEYNNTLSFSGGNDKSTFNLSYGNVYSNGILPGDNDTYKRNTFSLGGSTTYKALTVTGSANYIGKNTRFVQTGQSTSGIGSSFYEDILQIPVDYPVQSFKDYNAPYNNVNDYFSPFSQNPYYSINENGSKFKSDRFYGNVDVKVKANDWLTFQFQQGADLNNISDKLWNAKNAPIAGSWAGGGNDEGYNRQASVGNVIEGSERYFEFDSKLNALFSKKLNDDWDINGVVGMNYNDRGSRALYTGVENLAIPGFYQLSNTANDPTTTETETQRRIFGLYASAAIGYKGYAYLTLNARNDWSSTLPVNGRSFFYPGANLSVILSQALDLSSTPISFLKLRAAYGQTGSDTDPYRIYNTLSRTNVALGFGNITFPIGGVPGYTISNTLNNQDLKPEISTESEFGGEIKFLNNRIGLDVSYYNKITNDQILPIASSPSTGYTFRVVNFGKVRNRGLEVSLTGTPVKTKDISWDLGYTFTRNRNVVLELPDGLSQVTLNTAYDAQFLAKVGQPLGVFEAPVPSYDPQGRIIVASNGYPVVSPTNGNYGSSQRDFIMGLTNSFRYKEFTFTFTLDYRKGGVFYSGTADLLNFVGNDQKTLYNDRRTLIIPNSVVAVTGANGAVTYVENTVPITETSTSNLYYTSQGLATAYKNRILDKTFLKVRDITLTYALPKSIASKIGSDRATLTAFGRNLFTWLPKENRTIDPEVSNLGNDLSSEIGEFRSGPSTKSFGLSLNVSF